MKTKRYRPSTRVRVTELRVGHELASGVISRISDREDLCRRLHITTRKGDHRPVTACYDPAGYAHLVGPSS